jgi:hypothetical protein
MWLTKYVLNACSILLKELDHIYFVTACYRCFHIHISKQPAFGFDSRQGQGKLFPLFATASRPALGP